MHFKECNLFKNEIESEDIFNSLFKEGYSSFILMYIFVQQGFK